MVLDKSCSSRQLAKFAAKCSHAYHGCMWHCFVVVVVVVSSSSVCSPAKTGDRCNGEVLVYTCDSLVNVHFFVP